MSGVQCGYGLGTCENPAHDSEPQEWHEWSKTCVDWTPKGTYAEEGSGCQVCRGISLDPGDKWICEDCETVWVRHA